MRILADFIWNWLQNEHIEDILSSNAEWKPILKVGLKQNSLKIMIVSWETEQKSRVQVLGMRT